MSLTDAIAYARAHKPALRASLARIEEQRAQADVPRAQWLPTVGATAQIFAATANNTTGTYVAPGYLDIPRVGGTRSVDSGALKPYAATFAGIGATQEVYDFGRIAAQAAAADAAVDVERQRARAETLDVTFDVEEAYFAVFAAKSVALASEEAYGRSRAHRDLAKGGVDAGMRAPIELTRAESELTNFDIGRLRARGGIALAQSVLAATVGVPGALLDAEPAPPTPAEMPALGDAIEKAAARDPRLLAALAQLKADEARTRAVGSAIRPDISLTGTFSGRAGGAPPSGNGATANADGWLPNVANWDIGLVVSIPLFDGVLRARDHAGAAAENVRREEIADLRLRNIAAIRQAYAAVAVARSVLPGLERAVVAARANYAQADARFKAGMGTSIELADAEALRTHAEIQLVLGQFDVARTRAAFGRSVAEGA